MDIGTGFTQLTSKSGDMYTAAGSLIVIAIILSGLCLGIGIAFRLRRLESFGRDELFQALIGAALVGGLAIITTSLSAINSVGIGSTTIDSTGTTITPSYLDKLDVPGFEKSSITVDTSINNSHISQTLSYLQKQKNILTALEEPVQSMQVLAGVLSSVSIGGELGGAEVGTDNKNNSVQAAVSGSITPMAGLSEVSRDLADSRRKILDYKSLIDLHSVLLVFIDKFSFNVILPLGLLFRLFFPTRRLGGALIAFSIVAFLIFPLFMASGMGALANSISYPSGDSVGSLMSFSGKVSNSLDQDMVKYALSPIELLNMFPISDYLDNARVLEGLTSIILSICELLLIYLPLASLLFCAFAFWQLAEVLGGEFTLGFAEGI